MFLASLPQINGLLLAASTQRSIGKVILAVVLVGFAVFVVLNIISARAEVGSEIELAANRSEDLTDEELEGVRLDRSLGSGLALLAVIGVGLPLYWLGEPGRQEGRVADTDRIFTDRGGELYEESCANCHGPGGAGGVARTTLTDDSGEFVSVVDWKAPALTTVLTRFSEDEVMHVLNYGRNGIMPAWGAPGGGALTEQQLETLIYYMRSIQLPESEIAAEVQEGVRLGVSTRLDVALDDPAVDEWLAEIDDIVDNARAMALEADPDLAGDDDAIRLAGLELLSSGEAPGSEMYWEYGQILFDNAAAGGTYNCARCHTYGWSFNATTDGPDDQDGHVGPILEEYDVGGGFFGPNLTGGSTRTQFESVAGHADFIAEGQSIGRTYGRGGSGGNGQMPGFGARTDDDLGVTYAPLLTQDQIDAIVAFERNL